MLEPYEFQQEIIDRFKNEKQCALFMEAGCGKTIISINLMVHYYQLNNQILETIIFCPIIVLNNWKREILQCSRIEEKYIAVVSGRTKAKRLKQIREKGKKIIIINYEATRTDEILQALIDFNAKVVIGDESHKIKNQKIKTLKGKPSLTGAVLKVRGNAPYRQILSGTPIPDPKDIWSQYLFLDGGETFGYRYSQFKGNYFKNQNEGWTGKGSFPKWVFIPSKSEEYKNKLASKAVCMKKDECIDLPDLMEVRVNIEPSDEMMTHYYNVEKSLITWIEGQKDNPLVVQNALTKVLRLAEILSGYLRLEDESIHVIKNNPTLDGLMEIIESTGNQKVIVWSVFKQNYLDISKRLEKEKIRYVEVHGGVSNKKKLENVDIFNDMTNDCKVIISNPSSGGVGINLKSAPYSTYYSSGYSLVDFEQSRARNYRSGSIDLFKKITQYFLQHEGLITEGIMTALMEKKSFADNLLDIKNIIRGRNANK